MPCSALRDNRSNFPGILSKSLFEMENALHVVTK